MDIIEFDHEKYDLKNLLDAKHPFLERFRERAPGTYKHSQNVASLCEAVALELDLSPDIMKVLGTYHDVGKTYYPECFYENQSDSNPHDKLDPMVSFYLISRHISDTALILVQMEDFPKELIEPIVQHHGNSVVKSLANKSKLDEEMFRYRNCHPPKTLESAVLMICDSVEATIRSKEFDQESLDSEKIREIILNTIDRLEGDDQLDEIRLGDLKGIKHALAKDLESKYHKRDSKAYDEEDNKKIKETK